MRIGDIRVPHPWFVPVAVVLLKGRRSDRRLVAEGERIARDLGETINQRWAHR